MAFVGPSNYAVVVLHIEGSKALNIKLLLQREPVMVELGFLPVRFYVTSPFTSCLKNLALL
jgi:hypothetical protein